MKDDLKKIKMEDGLKKMEDNLKIQKWKTTSKKFKMEDENKHN